MMLCTLWLILGAGYITSRKTEFPTSRNDRADHLFESWVSL